MYLLSKKSDLEMTALKGKYQYRESLNNGSCRTTPSVSKAEKFTEKEANEGISCIFDDWELVKVSTAKKRNQYKMFK